MSDAMSDRPRHEREKPRRSRGSQACCPRARISARRRRIASCRLLLADSGPLPEPLLERSRAAGKARQVPVAKKLLMSGKKRERLFVGCRAESTHLSEGCTNELNAPGSAPARYPTIHKADGEPN